MKPYNCPHCVLPSGERFKVVRAGRFYRTSDSTWVQRYRCSSCRKTISAALLDSAYRQKKRQKNKAVVGMLCSGVSQRRVAILLGINRKTVVRTFLKEAHRACFGLSKFNKKEPKAEVIEFDDLETFEHTKCKALSVTLAVEHGTRRILGVTVSRMPASGTLSLKARMLYGHRRDERKLGRERLFSEVQDLTLEGARVKSDQNPHYISDVKRFFPRSFHQRFRGKRGCTTGQGELKKVKFDPLFSLNHTCAMLRANVNRLFRKTWCTTKRADRLEAHLILYAAFHNTVLI